MRVETLEPKIQIIHSSFVVTAFYHHYITFTFSSEIIKLKQYPPPQAAHPIAKFRLR